MWLLVGIDGVSHPAFYRPQLSLKIGEGLRAATRERHADTDG